LPRSGASKCGWGQRLRKDGREVSGGRRVNQSTRIYARVEPPEMIIISVERGNVGGGQRMQERVIYFSGVSSGRSGRWRLALRLGTRVRGSSASQAVQ
jgi:hypothetical protein